MGYGPLTTIVQKAARVRSNIHYLGAVPPEDVLNFTSGADVGLCGVENACLSYYLSLPNKLFEFLAAGVPSIVPNYPEMRNIVAKQQCGWVVGEADEDWRRAIEEVDSKKLELMRSNVLRVASEFSWEKEEAALHEWYRRRFLSAKIQ
jgi:glycosyltransferase involved in cell wall biosynthesis